MDRARDGYTLRAPSEPMTIDGEELLVPGELIESVSPARARAALLREHRRYLSALAADPDAWPSHEAEAGGILEAETAVEIHQIAGDLRAWVEAHRR